MSGWIPASIGNEGSSGMYLIFLRIAIAASGENKVMAKLIIEDLDPLLIERLAERARKNGRSLQSELKQILETSTPNQALKPLPWEPTPEYIETLIKKAELMAQQLASHSGFDCGEITQFDREKTLKAIKKLQSLRNTISPGQMSIREMREEGRRF